ncbi:MAG: hypothetical protein BZ136_06030 [Methanosphaera sp. rholeuAM74]|nr:MAG: hypothetical protein BZ136_06030 [Methanosphaera sp. rholeuAM74]
MKKIAVAVKDNGKKLEHFGVCEIFIVYDYDDGTHIVEYSDIVYSSKDRHGSEEWEKSADSISECDIVICEKIGLKAKAEVEARGIKVIETDGSIEEVLDNFIDSEIRKSSVVLP